MSPTQNLLPDTPTPLSSNPPPRSGRPASGGRRRIVEVVAGIGLVAVLLVLGSPLGLGIVGVVLLGVLLLAAFQTLVRRRPLRTLLVRDSASFPHGWTGKLLVTAVLIVIPATMVLLSLSGGRYADDSWKALLMLVVLAGSYLASRRLILTVLVGAVTVAVVSWALSPNLATARNGDPGVLAHLDQQAGWGMLIGYHDVAVAEVDLDATQPVRLAGIGADDTTPMEVGSMTKAMTGLVIADSEAERVIFHTEARPTPRTPSPNCAASRESVSPWAASGRASTASILVSLLQRSDPCYDRPCGCLGVDVSTVCGSDARACWPSGQ